MITISLCMIVKNEEEMLPACLESVADWVDEMIVVDTGSTDKTKEIASSMGAKVFDFEWINDFAAARNHAKAQASLREQVLQSFEVSLRNIGVSVIDSLVLHSPLETYDQLMEVWKTMEELIQKGVVRQLGISNCYDLSLFTRLYTNSTIQPSVLQNRFYQRSDYDVKLRQFCRDHGVIYQSFWTLTANPEVLRSNVIQQLVQQVSYYDAKHQAPRLEPSQ